MGKDLVSDMIDQGRRQGSILSSLLGFLAVVLLPGILFAEERTCGGDLGGVTVDNLRVSQGPIAL